MIPFDFDLDKVTRVEIIDNDGRSYIKWGVVIEQVSLQDDDRTLKIFLSENKNVGLVGWLETRIDEAKKVNEK
jgi:hypothetical protein